MGVPKFDSNEEEMKNGSITSLICLSEEFQTLKTELENIYFQSNVENFRLTAFQDALYAFLAQEEDERVCATHAH